MGNWKRDRKIEAIRKYIGNVGGSWPAYSYGEIPEQNAINACNSYAGAVEYQNILGLIDTTIWGNGKKGMIFTEYKIYFDNGMFESRGSISYKEINDSGVIPGEVFGASYNGEALKELLSILASIEGENYHDTVNEWENTIDDLTQGVQEVANVIEKGLKLINDIFNL